MLRVNGQKKEEEEEEASVPREYVAVPHKSVNLVSFVLLFLFFFPFLIPKQNISKSEVEDAAPQFCFSFHSVGTGMRKGVGGKYLAWDFTTANTQLVRLYGNGQNLVRTHLLQTRMRL
jgi:hypothetical protein